MTGTAVRQQHVTSADGTRICVTVTGDGPPLVVCPGALAVAGDWQAMAGMLVSRMSTYAVDRRGHGASGDGPYSASNVSRRTSQLSWNSSARRLCSSATPTVP